MGRFSFDSKENIDGWHDVLGGLLSKSVTCTSLTMPIASPTSSFTRAVTSPDRCVWLSEEVTARVKEDVGLAMGMVKDVQVTDLDSNRGDVNLQGLLNEVRALMGT